LNDLIDSIKKQETAEIAKATVLNASDKTISDIHKTYANESAQATKDAIDKEIASGKTLQDSFANYYKDMNAKAGNWNSTFETIANTITSELGSALKTVGEDIVNGGDAWGDLGKAALSALSDILTSLGEQLIVMAVVKAVSYDYVDAAIAVAGAAAAFVASGVVSALADSYATGTDYATAGYHTVGELGPETVYLPQGSSVANASETASGTGRASSKSGGTTIGQIVINSPTNNANDAARLMKRAQQQLYFASNT